MNLSKIYRGGETGDLKEFQFRSFGETEPLPPTEGEGFTLSGLVEPERPVAPVVKPAPASAPAPAAPGLSAKQQAEEAYARGRQEGLDSAQLQFESTTQALAQALEEVCRVRESLAQTGSRDMLRLVMAVAEQIIRRSIAVDPAVVLTIIENALQASVRADNYRISINPDDLDVVTKQKPLFLASISGLKNLSFDADSAISPGGCRVDSELGDVDATIETQLESIKNVLYEAITEG